MVLRRQAIDAHADGERDKYFNAEEAKAYGLVDEVFTPHSDKSESS